MPPTSSPIGFPLVASRFNSSARCSFSFSRNSWCTRSRQIGAVSPSVCHKKVLDPDPETLWLYWSAISGAAQNSETPSWLCCGALAQLRQIEWICRFKQILDRHLEMFLVRIFLHLVVTSGGSSMFLISYWVGRCYLINKNENCNSNMHRKETLEPNTVESCVPLDPQHIQ